MWLIILVILLELSLNYCDQSLYRHLLKLLAQATPGAFWLSIVVADVIGLLLSKSTLRCLIILCTEYRVFEPEASFLPRVRPKV